MPLNIRLALGLGGIPPYDTPHAYEWEKRLYWPILIATLLAIPAFYLTELSGEIHLKKLGRMMDIAVLLTFIIELSIMLNVSAHKKQYLFYNWLSLAIIVATTVSLLAPQIPGQLAALFRLMRLAIISLLIARLAHSIRALTPGSTPYILLLGFGLMLLSGGGFYWLEPTIHNYWDGLWLAFNSGLTVGYGDFVPTTGPSRLFAGVVIILTYGVMSLVTASIAAFFIGKEEKQLRREMHRDIHEIRQELQGMRQEVLALRMQIEKPGKTPD